MSMRMQKKKRMVTVYKSLVAEVVGRRMRVVVGRC